MGNNKIYVVGHKNPDTDSICSAIAYAHLKTELTGIKHQARRAGQINEETQYVLDFFDMTPPALVQDLRVQVKDVELKQMDGIKGSLSIKSAWERMSVENINTLPITRGNKLEGLITTGDIAMSYMDVYDSTILSKARTQYRNIAVTIGGKIIVGNEHSFLTDGKVCVAAADGKTMAEFLEPDDLVIIGDREDAQQMAIDQNVGCMVLCGQTEVAENIIEQATEKQIVLIVTEHDSFTVARLINQSIPVRCFMTKDNLECFHMRDYVDDVKEVMATKRYRDFPVVNEQGDFLGFISRRRLLKSHKKKVILVDHNEKSQSVDGIEQADVVEIIDHHRLNSIETLGPVFFRNQPVGCTATIVAQMYHENNMKMHRKIAGLLCCAILSDTLMFRSPTCTPVDEMIARELANIAEIDIEMMAHAMFRAGSNLKGKTAEEICFLDFKQFTVNGVIFGVGQVNSMSGDELKEIKDCVLPYLEKARKQQNLDMIFFMLTNIIEESSELLCVGQGAKEKIIDAFELKEPGEDIHLKGVVSRKKQLVPAMVEALQK